MSGAAQRCRHRYDHIDLPPILPVVTRVGAASAPVMAVGAQEGFEDLHGRRYAGHLLALHVTPASAEDRSEVARLARTVQAVTGDHVDITYVDQGYTGERAAKAAAADGIALEVVKLPKAKRGFVLLPRR